jgi:hypothetical protein
LAPSPTTRALSKPSGIAAVAILRCLEIGA